MPRSIRHLLRAMLCLAAICLPLSCLTPLPEAAEAPTGRASPPPGEPGTESPSGAVPPTPEKMADLDAWTAASMMSPGTNIGNTLENTTRWETGWGNPRITKAYVESLAKLGFKTVRLPVAWDTYAVNGIVQPEKFARVEEVVDWIMGAGMFAVVNIHWDGGWIDSSNKEQFADTHATFSLAAEKKFRGYWQQIAESFAGKNERLLFEGLNEETNFEGEGAKAYATLTRVNQLFIDTVRATGGNNEKRLLVVAGYHTDITKTCSNQYKLPKDRAPGRLFISVHYYTPWQFCGMTEDADWGKMRETWGTTADLNELSKLFDMMAKFSSQHDIPVFLGEYGASEKKESASRVRWMSQVAKGAISRKMVPVLWDTGHEVSRHEPYRASPELTQVLKSL